MDNLKEFGYFFHWQVSASVYILSSSLVRTFPTYNDMSISILLNSNCQINAELKLLILFPYHSVVTYLLLSNNLVKFIT